MNEPLVLGIDVGPQSACAVVMETTGRIVAQAQQDLTKEKIIGLPEGYHEQDPTDWWNATRVCLRRVVTMLEAQNRSARTIVAGAVDAASGSVVLLDGNNVPLRNAVTQSDQRARSEAEHVNAVSHSLQRKLGFCFDASFTLPKLLWLARHESETWNKMRRVVHVADYIVGKLTGVFDQSDPSNALKTGFDLIDFEYPGFIESELGIELERLPHVIRTGELVAHVSEQGSADTGLDRTTRIVAGMDLGLASQVASGARRIGDWNTVLDDTLTFKGLTKNPLVDPVGRVCNYLHPLGYWMPSCGSNVGARARDERFPNADKTAFDHAALALAPTALLVYPRVADGESFPINHVDTQPFVQGLAKSDRELYAAYLEGIAYVERLAYAMLKSMGAEIRERIYSSGNGANSIEWMQIRADVLGMETARTQNASAAMGSAIIAASRTLFDSIAEASAQMIKVDRVVTPRNEMVARYSEAYQRFLDALRQRGYIDG